MAVTLGLLPGLFLAWRGGQVTRLVSTDHLLELATLMVRLRDEALSAEEYRQCTVVGVRNYSRYFGAECGGAIALAVVSSLLLLAVVAVLVFLHKSGRLEKYL